MNGMKTMRSERCLSEEQMDRLLVRPAAGTAVIPNGAEFLVQQHLAACPACREEVAVLRSSLGAYREAATGFAAASYQARPVHEPVLETNKGWRGMLLWPATLAAAACVCGLAVSATHHPAASAGVRRGPWPLNSRSSGRKKAWR